MLTRRLQILLDEDRYERVARRAQETNRSVAAVIRDAIDATVPADVEARRRAFAAIASAEAMPVPDPDELRRELDEIRAGGL